jgi:hypothetical protein
MTLLEYKTRIYKQIYKAEAVPYNVGKVCILWFGTNSKPFKPYPSRKYLLSCPTVIPARR